MRGHLGVALLVLVATAALARAGEDAALPSPTTAVAFEAEGTKLADALAKAKAAKKLVFVDFSTAWCGPCRELVRDTFTRAPVVEFMSRFVSVRVDAEKDEGPALARKYGVSGYPSLVVMDADGEEIDRIVGYYREAEFLGEMRRILAGDGTLPAARKAFAAAGDDLEAAKTFAARLLEAKPDEAAAVYAGLVEKTKKDRVVHAELRLSYGLALVRSGAVDAAAKQAELLVRDFADTPAARQVAEVLRDALYELEPPRGLAFVEAARPIAKTTAELLFVEELDTLMREKQLDLSLERWAKAAEDHPDPANGLWVVAEVCLRRHRLVDKALVWARTAVEKTKRENWQALDTYAHLLWETESYDLAIQSEEDALAILKGWSEENGADNELVLAGWRAQLAVIRAREKKAPLRNPVLDGPDQVK